MKLDTASLIKHASIIIRFSNPRDVDILDWSFNVFIALIEFTLNLRDNAPHDIEHYIYIQFHTHKKKIKTCLLSLVKSHKNIILIQTKINFIIRTTRILIRE